MEGGKHRKALLLLSWHCMRACTGCVLINGQTRRDQPSVTPTPDEAAKADYAESPSSVCPSSSPKPTSTETSASSFSTALRQGQARRPEQLTKRPPPKLCHSATCHSFVENTGEPSASAQEINSITYPLKTDDRTTI